MSDAPLYLEPRLAPRLASLLDTSGLPHALVDGLGSPLNLVLPEQFAQNAAEFHSVLGRRRLGGRIYFAHKANRSSALVRRLCATGAALDAASLGELQHALASGFTGDRIMVTGPKDPEFLWLAARCGATVNADGAGELEAAAALVGAYGLPRLRVLLRLSGFEVSGVRVLSRRSRFGTSVKDLDALLDVLGRHRDALKPVGVGYHLDTTSLDEKAAALEGCLRAVEELRLRGFQPHVVDVGGGFGVNYLAHAAQWERYTTELTRAVTGRRPPLTWGGHAYGLRVENGTVKGALGLYPAHRPLAGPGYLDELLSLPAPTLGRPLGTLLLESLCDLYAEPGRALTDQCGVTLGRVLEVRPDAEGGPHLVRLALNAGDVGLEDHGVLVDPVLLRRGSTPPGPGGPVGVHLLGNLCLEADLITRRTVFLPALPDPGDLLAFANTAGYCMDFTATGAQRQPTARKVAVEEVDGTWRWCLDEEYWPVTRSGGTVRMRYENITDAIGNTPLVRIDPAVHGLRHIDLYAKLEMLNPFGSLKDRAAWNMVRGRLPGAGERGETVVELSSGNTAKALALIAGMHGLPFKSVTNRMRVPEIKDLLLLLGAEIEELPGRSECLDPTDTEDPLTLFHQQLGRTGGAHLHTDQYFNALNTAAHATGTGPEIVADLDGRAPDWFIACVGTAGSSTGVASALRAHDPAVRVVGLVGEKSDFIPGIRTIDEVQEVGIFDPATYDAIEPVSADEALDGMLTLLRRCGLLAGPTGGAAYSGAVRHLRPLDRESGGPGRRTAVFIVCDRVESYLGYVRRRRPELLGGPAVRNSVAALTEAEVASASVIEVADARKWLEESRPLVVDLRGPFAYAALHIEGSVNIVDELFDELLRGGMPFGRRQPVLLACPVGEKSARYAALLTRMGHHDVRSLAGGIVAWRDAGAPLVRD